MSKKDFRQNIANWKSSPLGETSKAAVEGLENLAAKHSLSGVVSVIIANLIAGGEKIYTEVFRIEGKRGGDTAAANAGRPEDHARWQRDAGEYWLRNPNASAKQVGRAIAEAGDNPDTIRKIIKKPN